MGDEIKLKQDESGSVGIDWMKSKIGKRRKVLQEKPYLITIGLAGVLVLVAGLAVTSLGFKPKQSEIEIIEVSNEEESSEGEEIFVDVGGAVEKPGMYQLAEGDRVNQALVLAGGLAEKADRDWVSKQINLASTVSDGQKIYIPFQDEARVIGEQAGGSQVTGMINVNLASLTELDMLWGVGPATAQKIIDNRPYASVEELLSKKAVKSNVYEAIKDKVSVY